MRPFVVALALLAACGGSGSAALGAAPAPDDGGAPDAAAPGCPVVVRSADGPTIRDPDVDEASGIVQSSRNAGVYWIHNDSGDSARAFAIGADGAVLTKLTFDTAMPTDIEDVAIEDAGDASYLYFGDIGDNDVVRKEVTIHRVAEPKLGGAKTTTVASEKMTVVYPDGPHNAETLLFDPWTKDLVIVTKTASIADVHRVGPFSAGARVTTQKVATLPIVLATGGEISRDGRLVAIRNYTETARVWLRQPGESVADALAREPCTVPIAAEKQGEAFAFFADGTGFVTVSEGRSPTLHLGFFE